MATQAAPRDGQRLSEPATVSDPASDAVLHDITGELEITGEDILAEHRRILEVITPEMWAVIERIRLVENARLFHPGKSVSLLLQAQCEAEAAARRSRRRYELREKP